MLEKPDFPDDLILACLQTEYGLQAAQLSFLPLGADQKTAVYRVETGEAAYFLKLRQGDFDELSLEIPSFLKGQGLQTIISPLETQSGQFSAFLREDRLILYPFIEGRDGYELALTDQQWLGFGATLKGIHAASLSPELLQKLPRETWSPRWREMVRQFQFQAEENTFSDPTAVKLAAFMREKRAEISHLVERANRIGRALQTRPLEFVLCHSDLHPGNLLLTANEVFYLVDWDQPSLAPKERDLVLLGGGATWNDPREIALFSQGYGQFKIDPMALAYYRYERMIQDWAVECELIFASNSGGENREQEYTYFTSNFLPGHELELARQADDDLLK